MDLHPSGNVFAVTLNQPPTNGLTRKWLRVYAVDSRNLITEQTFPGRAGTVKFSADGKWLAIGHDIRLIDTETSKDVSPWGFFRIRHWHASALIARRWPWPTIPDTSRF